MADLATTMRHMSHSPAEGDNVVPAFVLIEKRRARAEQRARVARTIIGQAAVS